LDEEAGEELEEEVREGYLAVSNIMFGVGVFALIYLPPGWVLRGVPEPPECDLMGDWCSTGEFRWVLKGKMKALLVNEDEDRMYLITVNADCFRREEDAKRRAEKRLSKIEEGRGVKILRRGSISICGHQVPYVLLVRKERGFLRRGRVKYLLELPLLCERTSRILWIKVVGGPWLPENLEEVLLIISSIRCHDDEI